MDIGLLARGDFSGQAQVAPDVPVVAENLSETVCVGRVSGMTGYEHNLRRRNDPTENRRVIVGL